MENVLVASAIVMLLALGVISVFVGFAFTMDNPFAAFLLVSMGVALMAVGFTFMYGLMA